MRLVPDDTEPMIAEVTGGLDGSPRVYENPDEEFYSASTMKAAVLIGIYRGVEAGRVDLDAMIPVTLTFHSVLDGSEFEIDDVDDTDPYLLARVGHQLPLRDLVDAMIVESSNEATNLVLSQLDFGAIQDGIDALGVRRMAVRRPIGDTRAAAAGIQNVVTAADLARVITGIATGRAAGADSCREMLGILSRQRHREGIPTGIPGYVISASKGGWVTRLRHDVAVVFPPDAPPYVQAVCTRGMDDEQSLAVIRKRATVAYARRNDGPA